jgi:hypothetical protein
MIHDSNMIIKEKINISFQLLSRKYRKGPKNNEFRIKKIKVKKIDEIIMTVRISDEIIFESDYDEYRFESIRMRY